MDEERDKKLFNTIADGYVQKDLLPTSGAARRQRLLQTVNPFGGYWNSVLEVGAGAGFTVEYLQGRFDSYLGVDYSGSLVRAARERFGSTPNVEFVCDNIRTAQFNRQFDLILMIGVLHHSVDSAEVLKQLAKLLKPKCWLVVNEPQAGNPAIQLARWIRSRTDSHYSADQKPVSRKTIVKEFREAGLSDVRAIPQGIFSTPFAEVTTWPLRASLGPARAACQADSVLESILPPWLHWTTWNVIVGGRREV